MISLAVGMKIPNYKFEQPVFVKLTLASAVTAGDTTLTVTQVDPGNEVSISLALKRGDVLILSGTNTEHSVVSKCIYNGSNYTITLQSGTAYSYSTGDSIAGYGTGWPEGWNHASDSYNKFEYTSIKPPGGGESGDYGFRFYATGGARGVFQSDAFDLNEWEEYCYYRVGLFFKQDVVSTGNPGFIFMPTQAYSQSKWGSTADTLSWTESTFNPLTYGDLSSMSDNGKFKLDILADNNHLWFDKPYIEHIREIAPIAGTRISVTPVVGGGLGGNTSVLLTNGDETLFTAGNEVTIWGYNTNGNLIYDKGVISSIASGGIYVKNLSLNDTFALGARVEEKNDGYWSFTEQPDEGVSWAKTEAVTKFRGTNNNLKWFNSSGWGERQTKYSIKMHFTNVSYSFYSKIRKFEEYCLRGDAINIHGLSTDLPELGFDFMQGKIEISNFVHNKWDREKVSFDFLFEEI